MAAMMSLPDSARRFAAAARDAGLDLKNLDMDETTRSAQDAATACACASCYSNLFHRHQRHTTGTVLRDDTSGHA
jgi:hypothetical protein